MYVKNLQRGHTWWHILIIPTLVKAKAATSRVPGQPDVHHKFPVKVPTGKCNLKIILISIQKNI
jgi:hypothetical protein